MITNTLIKSIRKLFKIFNSKRIYNELSAIPEIFDSSLIFVQVYDISETSITKIGFTKY